MLHVRISSCILTEREGPEPSAKKKNTTYEKERPGRGKSGVNPQIMYSFLSTNIAPENRPVEKEIPIGNHHF